MNIFLYDNVSKKSACRINILYNKNGDLQIPKNGMGGAVLALWGGGGGGVRPPPPLEGLAGDWGFGTIYSWYQ